MSLFLLALVGCPEATDKAPAVDTGEPADSGAGTDTDTADTGGDTGGTDDFCAANGFGTPTPWSEGPYGEYRHELAEDFTLPLVDGTEWHFAEEWTGCEQYIFILDDQYRKSDGEKSIWTKDLDALIADTPPNTHYFFVSAMRDEADAQVNIDAMVEEVEDVLAGLEPADQLWWAARLHVVSTNIRGLDGTLKSVLNLGVGQLGLGIDQQQRYRGMGSLADITRTDSENASWPFQNNMAYFAHEARYLQMDAEREDRLAAATADLVHLFSGEVISQYADVTVTLPDAAAMAGYDTFEIDVDMRCPDPEAVEYGNCGAWDYLAYLWVQDDAGEWVELSRFITTYHRESRWVVDATPMMAHLLAGGERTFRYEWAPSWNVQPTETRLSLRFSNTGKGYAPRSATKVATGGSFSSTYNDGREAVDVPISPAAKKVELWALTTGHGAGTNSCAEFCNHQHEFTVEGTAYLQEFPVAQEQEGCLTMIEDQMTPNQWGTWWYGRGGWCPGAPVLPFAVDVTDLVGTDGTATVSYRGLFNGETPPDGAGDVLLNAWIVVYE